MDNKKLNSAIILAGGNSVRMGFPKAWLRTKDNMSFLAAIVNTYKSSGIVDIVVVLNAKFATKEWEKEIANIDKSATIIKNSKPEKGRLYSLHLGLNRVVNESTFIHNVDNPFVESIVLDQLSNCINTYGVSIPSFQGKGGHPVIISQPIALEIAQHFSKYKTLKDVFSKFPKTYVEVNSNSILKNLNTPQELAALKYELA